MKRERLTRAQRREQTRERLLEAARTIFVKKGIAATSVEEISEAAGYTRGAFYSNFNGKPDLLIELLRRDDDRASSDLRAIIEESKTPETMKERAIAYWSQPVLEHDCFPLWVEATLLARREPVFKERIYAFQHQELDELSAYIRAFSERSGRPLPLQAEILALGLVSLCDGLLFFRMGDPQKATDKVLQTMLAGFFSCMLCGHLEDIPCANRCVSLSG